MMREILGKQTVVAVEEIFLLLLMRLMDANSSRTTNATRTSAGAEWQPGVVHRLAT